MGEEGMSENGNGHMNGNGHAKSNGHNINIKAKKGLTKETLQAAAVKSDGSPTKMAKILGVSKPTAHQHLQKPDIKKLVLDEREKALKKAGLTRVRAYKRVKEALDANTLSFGVPTKNADHDIRLKAAKLTAELHGDLKTAQSGEGGANIIVNMPVVVIEGKPLAFKVGNNG